MPSSYGRYNSHACSSYGRYNSRACSLPIWPTRTPERRDPQALHPFHSSTWMFATCNVNSAADRHSALFAAFNVNSATSVPLIVNVFNRHQCLLSNGNGEIILHLWGEDSFEESPPSLNPDAITSIFIPMLHFCILLFEMTVSITTLTFTHLSPWGVSNGTFQSSLLPQDESRVPCHFVWNSHFSSIVCHLCVRVRMHVFCLLQIHFLAEPLNAWFSPKTLSYRDSQLTNKRIQTIINQF
jgi:hypothetical protein